MAAPRVGVASEALFFPPGLIMNLSVHRSDPGMHYIVGRAHPTVGWLHLEFSTGHPGLDVQPVGGSSEFGVAFVAEILPSAADLVNVTAWDASGGCIGDLNTTHDEMFFHQAHPDHGAGDTTSDRHISWSPPENP